MLLECYSPHPVLSLRLHNPLALLIYPLPWAINFLSLSPHTNIQKTTVCAEPEAQTQTATKP